jgi:uncharacterized membrane protein YecN with MAPEG domain
MTEATITPVYAAILTLAYIWLSLRIPRLRLKYGVGIGDGNIPELARAVRVHGNFAEYVPLALLMLYFTETAGDSPWFIHALGLTLLLARGLHAYGLSKTSTASPPRFLGTVLTFFVLGATALMILFARLGA